MGMGWGGMCLASNEGDQGGLAMGNPIGIALVVVGMVLLAFGIEASESIGSSFTRLFTGAPTDKAIWLMIGGILTLGVGLAMSLRGPMSSERPRERR